LVLAVRTKPLELTRRSQIKLRLTQTEQIDDKPALVRRIKEGGWVASAANLRYQCSA